MDQCADAVPVDAVVLDTRQTEPVDARYAAWLLCQQVEQIDHPTAADVSRWAQQIRVWRSRHKDRIKVYGQERNLRLYRISELQPLAEQWRARVKARGPRPA